MYSFNDSKSLLKHFTKFQRRITIKFYLFYKFTQFKNEKCCLFLSFVIIIIIENYVYHFDKKEKKNEKNL